MDNGTHIATLPERMNVSVKPRPPSSGRRTRDGKITARVLPDEEDRLRVLIADDDADNADSLALLAGLWGYEALVARSGTEALEMALCFRPDILLMDVAMPGMNGFKVARAIRLQPILAGILLVAVTGYADDHHRQLGKSAGFDHYLVKPVEPSHIQTLLLMAADRMHILPTADVAKAGPHVSLNRALCATS